MRGDLRLANESAERPGFPLEPNRFCRMSEPALFLLRSLPLSCVRRHVDACAGKEYVYIVNAARLRLAETPVAKTLVSCLGVVLQSDAVARPPNKCVSRVKIFYTFCGETSADSSIFRCFIAFSSMCSHFRCLNPWRSIIPAVVFCTCKEAYLSG